MLKTVLIAVLASSVAACTTAPSTLAPGTETAGYGLLISGAKFGTAVGRDSADAPAMLSEQGFAYQGETACSAELRALLSCRDGDTVLAFQPLALDRRGHVYLKVANGKIAAIGWRLVNVPALEG